MNQKIASLERVSFIILLSTIGLSIVAFLPTAILPLAAVKTLVVTLGVLSAFILYILARLKGKTLEVSGNPLILTGLAITISVAISTVISQSPISSFFGKAFGVDTAGFIILSFAAAYLSYFFSKGKKERTLYVLLTVLGSFTLVALYQCIRLIVGGDVLSLGAFTTVVSTTIGTWHDFGTLTGFICIVSFVTLEFLPLTKRLKIAVASLFGLSVLLLVIVGLSSIWLVISIIAFAIAFYKYYLDMHTADKKWFSKIPLVTLAVAFVALVFVFQGSVISGPIVDKMHANYYEVGLPWTYTVDIAAPTIKEAPLFGVGPARFANQYMKYKPQSINLSQFWSFDFSSGANFLLTSVVTQGLIGFVLWILFLVYLFVYGCKGLIHSATNQVARYTLAVTIFGASFLWISLLTYSPSHVILFLTFIISGLFIGEYIREHGGPAKIIDYTEGKKINKVTIQVVSWILIAASIVWSLAVIAHVVAERYLQAGISALSIDKSIDSASKYINKSVSLYPVDTYYQAQAQVYLYRTNELIASIGTSTPDQALISAIGSSTGDAFVSVLNAEKSDPTNVYNFLMDAQISELAARLQYKDAYERAKAAYTKAAQLSPYNPAIYLAYSQLVYLKGDTTEGNNALSAALQLKPDYTDALFEGAVIAYNSKNYSVALAFVEQLLKVDPKYPNGAEMKAFLEKNNAQSSAAVNAVKNPATVPMKTPTTPVATPISKTLKH